MYVPYDYVEASIERYDNYVDHFTLKGYSDRLDVSSHCEVDQARTGNCVGPSFRIYVKRYIASDILNQNYECQY